MTKSYDIILTTTGSKEETDRLAEMLISRQLAACVQVINIGSTYMWQGKITQEAEFLLLIKTASHLYSEVEKIIVENHSYEIPEIIQIPIVQGLPAYLAWIDENTK
ncbi:MAG: divalent-cation tolerance protein CutA [Anaerolineaceae bacterium]